MSTPTQHAVAADWVFDGATVRRGAAVVIEGPRIAAVVPRTELPATLPLRSLPDGAWLAPGFIDVQVNGGGDVLFNDIPTAAGIRAIAAAHRRFGTTALLPTLISDAPEKTERALAAVEELAGTEPSIIGIHLEGPFLSPERPGVHDLRHIRPPTAEDGAMLTAPRQGVTVVTLAPERVPNGFIRQLAGAGIRICLGHSMATYAETRAAMVDGLTGFTHLFNAMRPLASREPGPIAAALESPGAWFGMIADGAHVDPAMLRLALRGAARPMLVTDAMPPVGGSRSTFALYGEDITVHAGRCTRKDGTLAGAALDMATAVRNCVRLLGVPLDVALRFASVHPAGFIGLDHWLGRLAPGYRADIVAIDPITAEVLETWIAGRDGASAVS
ncbi:MAG: N-acetylglucosamine-6-phosphate deacetylase [Rhizobiales bacterium]|nr:N-acetylglucosamine-6-phosphate deacetylase [Hyphomicrobiales bacterium]